MLAPKRINRAAILLVTGDKDFARAVEQAFGASEHVGLEVAQGPLPAGLDPSRLAAATVAVVERQFRRAALWMALAAALSAAGLVHGFAWTPGDTAVRLGPAWPFVLGYGAMAAVFLLAPWVTEPGGEHG